VNDLLIHRSPYLSIARLDELGIAAWTGYIPWAEVVIAAIEIATELG
jgi:hypothetical protein